MSSGDEEQPLLQPPLEEPEEEGAWRPADGGAKAWLVVAASLLVGGLRFGLFCSFSVIYVELLRIYQDQDMTNASFKAALVGSLAYGVMSLLSPAAGILADQIGIQVTTMFGGWVAMLGLLLSSWLIPWVGAMYFSLGLMFGMGMSLLSSPVLAVLGFHFKRRLGLANGIVFLGGSLFAAALPPVVATLIRNIGLPGALRVVALLMAMVIGTASVLKVPDEARRIIPASQFLRLDTLVNEEIFKNRKYLIWMIAYPIACFGYFVPFVHIVNFVNTYYPARDANIFVVCMALATGVGRISVGVISDLRQVNVIVLQQVMFVASGVFILLLAATPRWEFVLAIVTCIGLCDGAYFASINKISVTLCGVQGSTQAIGFLLGACCIPLTFGAPLAGYIFDQTQSYHLPFLVFGCFPIVAGLILTTMRCVPPRQTADE